MHGFQLQVLSFSSPPRLPGHPFTLLHGRLLKPRQYEELLAVHSHSAASVSQKRQMGPNIQNTIVRKIQRGQTNAEGRDLGFVSPQNPLHVNHVLRCFSGFPMPAFTLPVAPKWAYTVLKFLISEKGRSTFIVTVFPSSEQSFITHPSRHWSKSLSSVNWSLLSFYTSLMLVYPRSFSTYSGNRQFDFFLQTLLGKEQTINK